MAFEHQKNETVRNDIWYLVPKLTVLKSADLNSNFGNDAKIYDLVSCWVSCLLQFTWARQKESELKMKKNRCKISFSEKFKFCNQNTKIRRVNLILIYSNYACEKWMVLDEEIHHSCSQKIHLLKAVSITVIIKLFCWMKILCCSKSFHRFCFTS